MNRRKCGSSGFSLPLLGVGCWSFGGGSYWGDQDQRDVDSVVHRALEIGCNYFDTAEAYNEGASEESLGKALKGIREKAIIGTKISPSNTAPDVLRSHCEASLKRLQTDYIDIYMIHWHIHPHSIRHFTKDESNISNPPSVPKAFETLIRLKEEGKIKHLGISNFGVKQMAEAIETGAKIAVNELPYNLLMRAIESKILPFCREKNIGVIGYMPLMQGLLSGKYSNPGEVPIMRVRTRHFSGKRPNSRHGEDGEEKLTFDTIAQIRVLAKDYGIPMAHLAIAWCKANPTITCVLAGIRNLSQLEDNLSGVILPLDDIVVSKLNDITHRLQEKLGSSPDYYENRSLSRSW
jgi:myo-inositol catabolism protein IolS